MSEFKRIPGFSNYAINENGRVYDLIQKETVKQFILKKKDSARSEKENSHRRCKINGKNQMVTILQIVTYFQGDIHKNISYEYIDGDFTNLNIKNIRWWYRRKYVGKVPLSYEKFLTKIQRNSEGALIETIDESSIFSHGDIAVNNDDKPTKRKRIKRITFFDWIYLQRKRDDPIGEFSLRVINDPRFPQKTNDKKEITNHLTKNGACINSFMAFKRAFSEYRKHIDMQRK